MFKANIYSVSLATKIPLDKWIIVDLLSEVFGLATKIPLDKWIIVDLLSEVFGQGSRTVAFIVVYILLWFSVTLFMYGKRIFIRVK